MPLAPVERNSGLQRPCAGLGGLPSAEPSLITVLLLTAGCAYDVEKWWEDLAEADCKCVRPGDVDACVDEHMAAYEASEYWDCADDQAPVDRWEVRDWTREYNEDCSLPDFEQPLPEDPEWYLSCDP